MNTITGKFIRTVWLAAALSAMTFSIAKADDSITRMDCEQMSQLAYDLAEGSRTIKQVKQPDGKMWFDMVQLRDFYLQQYQLYHGKGFNEIFIFTFQAPRLSPEAGKAKIYENCMKNVKEVNI